MNEPRLAVVSDLHFRKGDEDNKAVKEKLAWLSTELRPGDTLLIPGDVTDDGLLEQYHKALAELRPFVDTVKVNIRVAPGNHDFGRLGNFYDPNAVRRFHSFCRALGPMADNPANPWRVFAVDTCLRTGQPFDFAQGRLGWMAAKRIVAFAVACRSMCVASIVLCHHTPFADNDALAEFGCRLQDRERFMRATSGVVDMVVCGHQHKRKLVRDTRTGGRAGKGTIYYQSPAYGNFQIFTCDDLRGKGQI
jgi:3',5'-cyclic AMP phosphodiesterase CpdA